MKGTPAIYLGRIVEKENFRAFVYAPDGSTRLVDSWDEFEACMQSGLWFATQKDAQSRIEVAKVNDKPKTKPSRAKKVEFVEPEIKDEAPDDLAFEVTDDFLPKG